MKNSLFKYHNLISAQFTMCIFFFYFNVAGQNVGVGESTPATKLEIKGDSGTDLLNIKDQNEMSRLYIENTGNVGIGTISPATKLEVTGGARFAGRNYYNKTVSVSNTNWVTLTDQNGVALNINSVYRIRLVTNSTGTDSGAEYLAWFDETAGAWKVRAVSVSGTSSNHPALLIDAGAVKVRTFHTNNYPVEVFVEEIEAGIDDVTADIFGASYQWQRAGATLFYEDGSVGIGNSNPNQKLEVTGNTRITGLASGGNNALVTADSDGDLASTNFSGNSNDVLTGQGTFVPATSLNTTGDNLGNHTATTTLNMSNNNITNYNLISGRNVESYDKLRVWNSDLYSIGMHSAMTLGFLNDYAMTFSMNDDSDRGFVWRDVDDTEADGAMSLTTDGRLYLKSTAHFNEKVGVGLSNPSTRVHLYQSSAADGVTDMLRVELNRGDFGSTPSGPAIVFKDQDTNNGTNEARIKMMTVNASDYGDNDEAASNLIFETTNGGTASDKMIITGRGDIGIGTINPTSKLTIAGGIGRTAHNNGHLEGSYNNVGANSDKTNPVYTIGSSYNPNESDLNNMYGIGYSHTNASFITDPGTNTWGMYVAADGDARVWLAASEGGSSYFNAGNVGIGTASPSELLEVYGSSPTILVNNPSTRGNAFLELNRGSDGRDRSLVAFANASNTDWFAGIPYNCGGSTDQFMISRQDYLNNCGGVTYTPEFVILANGNVGIGVTSPSYKLQINGRIRSNGINETSDIRLKKNISTLENGLDKVLQLRGVTYDWRTDEYPDLQLTSGQQVGLIAQEIEKILPQVVGTDNEGFKSIEYSHLIPVLIEAIKELKTENDDLKAKMQQYDAALSQINIDQLKKDYPKNVNNAQK